jgi:hypothetical protein
MSATLKQKVEAYKIVMQDIQVKHETLRRDGLEFESRHTGELLISLGRLQSQLAIHEVMVKQFPDRFPKEDPTAVEVLY